jgi:putative transposase
MVAAARRFGIGLGHLQYWLARTRGQRLDRVDWSNQSNAPRVHGRQTKTSVQRRVLALRRELRQSDLGFVGAQAIQDALRTERPQQRLPSLRTIGRILKRHGALDAVRRMRRSAPPAGWYLPEVAAGMVELDAFDVIEDLPLEGGPRLDVLTTRALWGSVCGAWISAVMRARWLCERLETHWRAHGCPAYAQFDNDSRFQGTHTHPDVLGQVIRFCLSLGVTPVFAPAREHGPQNLNESFNYLWQQKGLAPLPPRQRVGVPGPERPVRGCLPATAGGAGRSCAWPTTFPQTMDVGPAPTTARDGHLLAANR